MLWELNNLNLMPDDEIHFHFELTDNDNISGPKKLFQTPLLPGFHPSRLIFLKV
ncbi:MAG: hypothetical protein CM15mP111_0080 [Hyphomicrobiales bacterium]|nr:MAG: hypothetical protein CM15mP111_0080 [Hyphomicrobiales bacterium]